MADFFSGLGSGTLALLEHLLILLLCVSGIVVSCFTFTGLWLIGLAALLAQLFFGEPSWWMVAGLLAASAFLEVLEWAASFLGIAKRGGSSAAGWAALGGSLVGMMLGGFIPIPVLGSLVGLLAGGFLCAYGVERRRMERGAAAHVARGAVWARLLVLLLKLGAALIGTIVFFWGLYWG